MTWGGALRAIEADHRRRQREAARRQRELEKQRSQLEKMEALERAAARGQRNNSVDDAAENIIKDILSEKIRP